MIIVKYFNKKIPMSNLLEGKTVDDLNPWELWQEYERLEWIESPSDEQEIRKEEVLRLLQQEEIIHSRKIEKGA